MKPLCNLRCVHFLQFVYQFNDRFHAFPRLFRSMLPKLCYLRRASVPTHSPRASTCVSSERHLVGGRARLPTAFAPA